MSAEDHRQFQDPALGLYLSLPDDFPAACHVVDAAGHIKRVSDKWLDMLGYERDDVLGRRNVEFLTPESRSFFEAAQKERAEPRVDSLKYEFVHKNGSTVACSLSASFVLDKHGKKLGGLAILEGLQGEHSLIERLQLKSRRLQSCLEGTNAGTWEWNVQTGETQFNARWAEIVGYTLEELRPNNIDTWLSLAHPVDLARSEAALNAHWAGETDFYDIEARMRHKDGHWVWVRDRGRVFTWTDDGAPEWMFGTHFSIDHERKIGEQADRMRRLLDRMGRAAGIGGWELDVETEELLWTDVTRKIHGVDEDYLPNVEEGLSFYAPEARPIITAAVEQALEDGTPWDLELPFIRKSGERIWVRALGEAEFENGAPRRLFGAFQDITNRKRKDNELQAAKEYMRLAARSGGIGLWSLDVVDGHVTWDELTAAHFQVASDALPVTMADWQALLPQDQAARLRAAVQRVISGMGRIELELDFYDKQGALHSIKVTGEAHRDSDGLIERIQGACFDHTAQRRLTLELQEQSSKLSVTLSSIGDGVITTDAERRITWINEEAVRITGWALEDAVGRLSSEVLSLWHEDAGEDIDDPVLRCLRERKAVTLDPDTMLRRKDGADIAVDDSAAPIFDDERRAIGSVVVFRDVSEQRKSAREMAYRASHDLLTGLLNRSEFERRLDQCLDQPVCKTSSYLMFVDLDHFKQVNDTLGHDAGDDLLRSIGQTLEAVAGDDAIVGRRGGDEFVLLVRAKNAQAAKTLGKRLCEAISQVASAACNAELSVSVGASVGLVELGGMRRDASHCLKCADLAAYQAKSAGRGQVCFWSDEMAAKRPLTEGAE